MAAHEGDKYTSPPHDWLLATYVHVANSGSVSFGITLNVSGSIVSGTLIGWREYMTGVVDKEWASAQFKDKETKDGFLEAMSEPRRLLEADQLGEDDGDAARVGFIHLRNTHIHSPDGGVIPSNSGSYWRGRLSSVDGFVIGALSTR